MTRNCDGVSSRPMNSSSNGTERRAGGQGRVDAWRNSFKGIYTVPDIGRKGPDESAAEGNEEWNHPLGPFPHAGHTQSWQRSDLPTASVTLSDAQRLYVHCRHPQKIQLRQKCKSIPQPGRQLCSSGLNPLPGNLSSVQANQPGLLRPVQVLAPLNLFVTNG